MRGESTDGFGRMAMTCADCEQLRAEVERLREENASLRVRLRTRLRQGGHERAQKRYPLAGRVCAECEVAPATDRHHWDGDQNNNAPTNVVFVCVRCHHTRFHPENLEGANAWRRTKTHCLRGHPLSGDNLHIDPRGARVCKACTRERNKLYARALPPEVKQARWQEWKAKGRRGVNRV